MFSLFRKKRQFFTADEQQPILAAIRAAEKQTSGEVRLFIESRCRFVDPLDRAVEIFYGLKMEKTDDRNAVLVYVAMDDRQLAIFGDEGIHQKVGSEYWNSQVMQMLQHFRNSNHADGLVQVINAIGEALSHHFPYNNDTDKNELPDDIVFGK